MPWTLSGDVELFAARAGELLAAHPAEHTIALTAVETLRGGHRWSDEPALFGWHDDGGAVLRTPPFELLLAAVPEHTAGELVDVLRKASVPGVHGLPEDVERFAAAWTAGTPLRSELVFRMRLHELGDLRRPRTPGRARPAADGDRETAVRWMREFQAETGTHATDVEPLVDEQISGGRLWLWEDEAGTAASLAGRTTPVAGVARIAPVYTPPVLRRRGYGAAVTAACTADALASDADRVVLFTDLANPTANAIYRRIGFRPVSDRHIMRFEP